MAVEFLTTFAENATRLRSTAGAGGTEGPDFGEAIKNAIDSVDKTQKAADKEITQAVTAENPDIHKTIIALQTADLKFQFGLQVRNKLIGAYEEVMRMQV